MLKTPKLFADARGIWREDREGSPFGVAWNEIHQINAYKLDLMDDVETIVEIQFEFGEFLELSGSWDGFASVVLAITRTLQSIDPKWFDQVQGLSKDSESIVVWTRA